MTISQIYKSIASEGNTFKTILGYNYFAGLRKASGSFQFGISRDVYSNTYYVQDLAAPQINGYNRHNVYITYNQYKPSKYLRQSHNSLSFSHHENYLTHERTGLDFNFKSFNTLLNYNSFFWGGGTSPLSNKDYYEPRTEGRYNYTSEYWYVFLGISSDYRKKIAVDFSQNISNFYRHNTQNFPAIEGYESDLSLRLRFNDHLFVNYKIAYNYDPYNPGFATFDSSAIIYGGRKLHTVTNEVSAIYTFDNKRFLNLNIRHYWRTGHYLDYYALQNDGSLLRTETDYQKDFNTNYFNIDLVYSWRFAPGSDLILVYKNAIARELTGADVTKDNFSNNFNTTINAPQTNSISLKVLYYLDYQYLKRRSV
jgi:hypothetical protein